VFWRCVGCACAHGDVTLTTLVSFSGTNGANPRGPGAGQRWHFYGTNCLGGANGYGSLFQLTRSGTLATLISFDRTNNAPSRRYAGAGQ